MLPPKIVTPELTVDRYVASLYPRLAWDATVRLGDAIIAGRLVERVLQRAWRERERFAAPEALLRHASESADAAIAREEARRVSVTHFDPEDGVGIVPGDLSGLSLSAVTWRLRRGPMETPAAAVPVQPTPRASAPVEPPRASWATPHAEATNGTSTASATPATPATRATETSRATPRTTEATRPRPSGRLRSASYISAPKPASWRRPVMMAGPVVLAVLGGLVWRFSSSEPAGAQAWHAASDTTAAAVATGRGERRDTVLSPTVRAILAPQSRVSVPAAVTQGVRGFDVRGDVALVAGVDSTSPLVLRAHGHRLESVGGTVVLSSAGDTVDVFAEAGEVMHIGAALRTRIAAGAVARLLPDGSVVTPAGDDASRRFAWRSGRFRIGPTEVRALRAPLGVWFGLDVVSDVRDTVSLDVPLDSVNAVVTALRARKLAPTLAGTKLTISPAPPAAAPRVAGRVKIPQVDIELPSLRKLPGVP